MGFARQCQGFKLGFQSDQGFKPGLPMPIGRFLPGLGFQAKIMISNYRVQNRSKVFKLVLQGEVMVSNQGVEIRLWFQIRVLKSSQLCKLWFQACFRVSNDCLHWDHTKHTKKKSTRKSKTLLWSQCCLFASRSCRHWSFFTPIRSSIETSRATTYCWEWTDRLNSVSMKMKKIPNEDRWRKMLQEYFYNFLKESISRM